tara:strand:- start:4171 stop:4542 length:372 start_codon:yes stop_codon:yes gene_type:complete
MIKMRFRTRRSRLKHRIMGELSRTNPNIDTVIDIFEEFESDNINSINKLKRKKKVTLKKISGALKQSISAHGPITKELIGSASKRIYGNILDSENNIDKINIRDIIFGFVLCVILFLAVNWLI